MAAGLDGRGPQPESSTSNGEGVVFLCVERATTAPGLDVAYLTRSTTIFKNVAFQ